MSETAGLWISRKAFAWGLTDMEPLSGRVQFKKWQEQSWQLFIHLAATCAEVAILRDETWCGRGGAGGVLCARWGLVELSVSS